MAAMIRFAGISVNFGDGAGLRDIDLDVPEGALCVLVGTSGAGKSTLMRLVNRLVVPSAGTVTLAGKDIATRDPVELRRGIGYAIQSVGLFPHRTVAENIAIIPALLGWEKRRITERTDALMTMLQLDPALAGRYPHALSGGQAQRVGLARALAADPAVLLMDEPFGAVDPIVRRALRRELAAIHRETGKTILLVTHDAEEALELATLLVVMREGRILAQGSPLELTAMAADPFVRELLGGAGLPLRRLDLLHVRDAVRPGEPEAMAPEIDADASQLDALRLMLEHGATSLVVTEAGSAVGALRFADLDGRGRT
ncbi:MAG: putative transporter ATP-binding protein [Rubritepida sp.]|nr:putative transporter ATP-binding protein [Rubritepida sp.]